MQKKTLNRIDQWIATIRVKSTFKAEPTNYDIKMSSTLIISQLREIAEKYKKVIQENFGGGEIDDLINNFELLVYHINNDDNAKDVDASGSWTTWTDAFNEYMTMLYDIADERVIITKGDDSRNLYKFIFIE